MKIASLVSNDRITDTVTTLIKPTTNLYVSAAQNLDLASFDTVISCTPQPLPQPLLKTAGVKAYLHLPCQTGKLGSRDLRNQLGALRSLPSTAGQTLICCPTGTDLAVGTALAYLCLHVADDGTLNRQPREARSMDKPFIKQRLSWITTSNAALNPSRATLQSVNSVLMSSSAPATVPAEPRNPADFDPDWTPVGQPPPKPQAQALFAALQASPWTFTRHLQSAQPTHPSGRVTGTATFTPTPLADTLLYTENGEFVTDTGMTFSARRRYVYQLIPGAASETEEEEESFIRVRFFDDAVRRDDIGDSGEGVGGVFVEMGKLSADLDAVNRARHLCGEDVYVAKWRFGRGMLGGEEGEAERWWEVRYDVEGPRKGYVSSTRYTVQTV